MELDLDGLKAAAEAAQESRPGEWTAKRDNAANPAVILALIERVEAVEAKEAAVEALFSGGPDTVCRTVWRDTEFSGADPIECVEVPMDDLRAALSAATPTPDTDSDPARVAEEG